MATPKISNLDEPMTPSSSFLWTSSDLHRMSSSSTHSLSDTE
ncbi:unnamed protein product [Schistosoma curassoni]|nr:unnamed protein product [Schistosoma curassoni]